MKFCLLSQNQAVIKTSKPFMVNFFKNLKAASTNRHDFWAQHLDNKDRLGRLKALLCEKKANCDHRIKTSI